MIDKRYVSESMRVEGYVTDKFNIYKFVRDILGPESLENVATNAYGAIAIRTWTCGCTVARRAMLDLRTGVYYLYDEYEPCEQHKNIALELSKQLKKKVQMKRK
ncbi:MAG: hypothetical protein QXH44_09245 [Pyrobaculum sp.]